MGKHKYNSKIFDQDLGYIMQQKNKSSTTSEFSFVKCKLDNFIKINSSNSIIAISNSQDEIQQQINHRLKIARLQMFKNQYSNLIEN